MPARPDQSIPVDQVPAVSFDGFSHSGYAGRVNAVRTVSGGRRRAGNQTEPARLAQVALAGPTRPGHINVDDRDNGPGAFIKQAKDVGGDGPGHVCGIGARTSSHWVAGSLRNPSVTGS